MNGSSQSIHITLIAFVARKLLPQQGQIYFLVLLGFFGLIVVAPFPDFPPDTPILEDVPLTISRGDYQSRMNGYATARQNGWMSANDIRELEILTAFRKRLVVICISSTEI